MPEKNQTQPELRGGRCLYTPYVYEASGRVSTCFFDTACGLEYVGMPLGSKCKNCDRIAIKEAK
jgi:hypothetical protein